MERTYPNIQLNSLDAFCAAATLNSFTKASATLGITPAAVSRSIGRLETRLGVRLFIRTTRKIRLTDAGEEYFSQCQSALSQIAEAERRLTGQQLDPAGTVRISMPTTYGHHRILPLLPAFHEKYPNVKIEAQVSNRNVNFSEEDFDIAVRVRTPKDSNLIVRKIEDAPIIVAAAPAYLAGHGTPTTPEDLANHECIQFALPSTGRTIPWEFLNQGMPLEIETQGCFSCFDDVVAGVTLARAGGGLFQTFRFLMEKDLEEGRLEEVLVDYSGCTRQVSLLYPHGRHLPLRVRVLIDFLLDALRK